MAFSIQTNVNSLIAQENLRVNSDFQSRTIQRLTSGFRINQSGDDAAGLAIANKFRSDVAELTQGVRNANDGISTLQIVDGGMNNISKMLDRLKTLATQSASGTYSGDRNVLNKEFNTLLSEIDRQSQAVGLNQGGQFARSLSVFIGGGKTATGGVDIDNGSVTVDLSASTVDAKSLGLKGVQAAGVSGTDIGSGSATSVANVLGNGLNTTAAANTTSFVLRGPGFGDASGVKISVNTSGVGSASGLADRINAAIQGAENIGTEAASALKDAGVRASIVTGTDGKQRLAFTSANSAFQVEAGDRMANALMGNFERNAVMTGSNTDANVNTNAGGAAKTLTLAVDGGTAFSVTVSQGTNASKGQIVKDLNDDASFNAVAEAYLDGNQVAIRSKGNSSSSSVAITTTAFSTALGLTGTATAAAASTGAAVETRVMAAGATSNLAGMVGSGMAATTTITGASNDALSLTVGSTTAALTLTAGTALTKEQLVADLNSKIGGSALNGKLTASLVDDRLVLTAATPGEAVTVGATANNAYTAFGLTAGASVSANVFATSDTIKMRFTGGGMSSPVDIALTPTVAGATTLDTVLTDLQSKIAASTELAGAGVSLTTSSAGNRLTFTSTSGEKFNVTVTGDTTNKLGFGSFAAAEDGSIDYTTNKAGGSYSTGIASGTGNALLEVSLNGEASSSHTLTVALDGGDAKAGAAIGTGALTNSLNLTGATGDLLIRIDGSSTKTITGATLGTNAATSLTTVLGQIQTALGASATVSLDSANKIVITSATKGAGGSVEILAGSDNVYSGALNLTEGAVNRGTNATLGDVVDRMNAAISADPALLSAGLVASDNGGKLELASNNGTYFRVAAYGSGDVGFGNDGASFAGVVASSAPTTSAVFNAQGADMSSQLAFSDLKFGGDDQTVTITASDSTGAKHSLGVVLRDDGSDRNARTIDEALNKINSALNASADSTLKKILAAKVNDGGAEKIRFMSTLSGFQVSLSSTPGGTGLTPPTNNLETSSTVGDGANISIDTESGATKAIEALAVAVTKLGTAQAAVGKAQNQLGYAVNLAQSQISSFSAAESRIRDTDIASEAANLTKAQVLQQASMAAMAQANSAPQAVLALLRG